jgi:hypothetical protein
MGYAGSWDMLYDPRKTWDNGQGAGLKNLGKGRMWGDQFKGMGLNGASTSDEAKQNRLNGVGDNAQYFANNNADHYLEMNKRLDGSLNDLQAQARGENSVSALQLKQAQQGNLASQRSMAASASPNNSAMAARTAANNMNRQNYGLAGQQAVAGLQERNQAQQNYANMLGGARGQDVQGATGGYNAATGAYGGGLNGQKDPTQAGQWAGAVGGLFGMGAK